MNVVDPRERMSDRELFVYLLLGDLPRRGWSGRGRALAYRAGQVAAITVLMIAVVIAVSIAILLFWASTLQVPA